MNTHIPDKKLISIVCPVYNEEENIHALYDAVNNVMQQESYRYDWELVFTDNHSTDRTFELIKDLVSVDPRVRVYRFSRNYGYQLSIYTGYTKCRGACSIQLDCDLQDPPSLIPSFLRLWEEGNRVVYGVRRTRQEGQIITLMRKFFYRFLNVISETDLPRDAGDFRLIDRCIIDELATIQDPNIYIRGRITEMGFRQIGVIYDRNARLHGHSKFRYFHNVRLAIDAITSHSAFPLRLASYFGFFLTVFSLLAAVGYIIAYSLHADTWTPGFATLVLLNLLSLGLLSLFLGMIGEYISRLHDHIKKRYTPIIEDQLPVE